MTETLPTSRRVLVVDDDPSFVTFVCAAIEQLGVVAEVAPTGSDALHKLASGTCSGVLLDLGLPDIDGLEVLHRLRQLGNYVPVVILTGVGSIPKAVEATKLGALDFLEKPVRLPALAHAVGLLTMASADSSLQVTDRRSMVERLADASHGPESISEPSVVPKVPAVERLAKLVLASSIHPEDFRSGRAFAKAAGVGYGTIRHWCRSTGVDCQAFTKFARLFRALRQAPMGTAAYDLLDVVTPNALASLLRQAGPAYRTGLPLDLYCAGQTLIPPASPLIRRIIDLARRL